MTHETDRQRAIESAMAQGREVRRMAAAIDQTPDEAGLWDQERCAGDWSDELAVLSWDEIRAAFMRGLREEERAVDARDAAREASYGLIYGREGADYPDVAESGPFKTADDAIADLDEALARRLGGVMLVRDYRASDGISITTGSGIVVRVIS